MFDPQTLPELQQAIRSRATADKKILDDIRADVRRLTPNVRAIKPRSATATSIVASDGGNNQITFDPFFVQLVRVVDSYGKQLCLDVVSPTTDTDAVSAAQFKNDEPKTALGRMMKDLGAATLSELSHMIPGGEKIRTEPERVSPSWVLVYRDLCEWAVLYDRICYHSFATDTLIVRDGLLRSKLFRGERFITWRKNVENHIARHFEQDRRRVFLVGIAKHSKVLAKYQLGMAIEGTFPPGHSLYVSIPRDLEAKAYVWPEYARGAEEENTDTEAPKFVAGEMYLVRFGPRSGDPIWAIDLLSAQVSQASEIFGYLLADSIDGFPVPFYPRSLQKAHEHAQVVGFDMDVLEEEIYEAVKSLLPPEKTGVLDAMRLNPDPSGRRYE